MKIKLSRRRKVILISAVLAVLFGLCIFLGTYYHADDTALAALVSDDDICVEQTSYGWLFDGANEDDLLIFYPGARVEASAYAPLCRQLAVSGFDVCLVEMPFRLSIFGKDKADDIVVEGYKHRYICGHSLGGVTAAAYADERCDMIDGVVLLASYTATELDDGMKVVLVYGSQDGVMNKDRFDKCLDNVPDDRLLHIIDGGNHSQFGSYGLQHGDNEADIGMERQIDETVEVISEAFR